MRNINSKCMKVSRRLGFWIVSLLLSFFAIQETNAKYLTGKCGNNVTYSLDTMEGTLEIYGSGPMKDYDVNNLAPWYEYRESIRRVEVTGVTRIGAWSLCDLPNVTKITLPSSLQSIGQAALARIDELKELYLPESLTVIEDGGIMVNEKLEYVYVGNKLEKISYRAFYGCKKLKQIVIPASVKSLGDDVFGNCESLTSMQIDSDYVLDVVMDKLGKGCGLKNVIIGDAIKRIRESTFEGAKIETITLGASVGEIDDKAFYRCYNLETVNTERAKDLSYIGDYAFAGCSKLKAIELPKDIKKICEGTFYGCNELQNISFENFANLETISALAFYNCKKLTDVILNEGVRYIDELAFSGVPIRRMRLPHSLRRIFKNSFDRRAMDELVMFCDYSELTKDWFGQEVPLAAIDVTLWSADYLKYKYDTQNVEFYAQKVVHVIDTFDYCVTPTSLVCENVSCNYEEAGVQSITIKRPVNEKHLMGGFDYEIPFNVVMKDGTTFDHYCFVTIPKVNLETTQPLVRTVSKAVLLANTNITEPETNVGFELRKYAAPAELPSTKCAGVIVGGLLTAEVQNLSYEYYKCRAFYHSADGETLYGDWVTFDPTSTMYCDPIVHTYDVINVSGRSAKVKGIVIEGTETIVKCGVQLYENGKWVDYEQNEIVDNTFTVTIPNLANGEYRVRAYAVLGTKRVYGEERTFTVTYYEPEAGRDALILVLNDGSNDKFILTVRPSVSVSGNKILISGNNLNASYEIGDVEYFYFGSSMTGIHEVKTEEFVFEQRGNDTYFISCDNASKVNVYCINGVKQSADINNVENGVEVSLSSLPKGVYIISSKGKSLKINKR